MTRILPTLAVVILLAVACGGGGGGGGGGDGGPTTPTTGVVFTPTGSAGANSVYMTAGAASSGNGLALEIRASQVSDVHAVAFDIVYPSNLLRFDGDATEGQFLSGNGSVDTELLVTEEPTGTVIVGLTRLGSGAGASGTGVLLTLEFTAVSNGNGQLDFARNSTVDRQFVRQGDVTWLGGSIRVAL